MYMYYLYIMKLREELPNFKVFLDMNFRMPLRYISYYIGKVVCKNIHLYVMYTYCTGYAVSVLLCDLFVRCNRLFESL